MIRTYSRSFRYSKTLGKGYPTVTNGDMGEQGGPKIVIFAVASFFQQPLMFLGLILFGIFNSTVKEFFCENLDLISFYKEVINYSYIYFWVIRTKTWVNIPV